MIKRREEVTPRAQPLVKPRFKLLYFPYRQDPDNDTDDHEGGTNYAAFLVAIALIASPVVMVCLAIWLLFF